MKNSKSKIILHPVRIRISQTLLNGKKLNAQQISEYLQDVPQATLYRHLNKLLEAGVIEVVQENQVRGTVEKIYGLKQTTITSAEDLEGLTKEQHLDLFLTFTTQVLKVYEDYLNRGEVDLVNDQVSYRMANLYLTDEENMELMKQIALLLHKAMENKPTKERTARNYVTMVIPEKPKTKGVLDNDGKRNDD
jgi:DNA-binding transcriptional ArsR family regulator